MCLKLLNKWVEKCSKKVSKFGVGQWCVLKLTMVSFGMLLGAYLSQWVMQYQMVFWAVFIVGYIYLLSILLPKK
jgi:uncharacterized membrane protein YoaK (UPF0700 family)